MHLLTYASILAAVDPVAVLAIFQDIGVNMSLYFLVFGESLLNDGVTVVLYNTMISLSNAEDEPGGADHTQYVLAILSFFCVVFGGLSVGVIMGMASSFIVKFARHTRVIEPLIILVMAYLAYIMAETIHWSGIISLIGCGIAQRRYAFLNLSKKSHTTVKYSVRTLSTFSDCIIFLYLGIVTISKEHEWHWELVAWTIFLCTILRFISVAIFTAVLNTTRVYRISFKEQFIIAYGGLRGAVGFSLADILPDNSFKNIFLTATLAVVYFTVFIQGSTIKFFVRKLNIKTKMETPNKIFHDIHERATDHIMAGIESILGGVRGHMVLETIRKFDNKYVKKILIHRKAEHEMTMRFQEIALEEHYARLYGPAVLVHQHKVNLILTAESMSNPAFEPDENESITRMANGMPTHATSRQMLLEAFKNKGSPRKNRRMSIHPEIMTQQINHQRQRARSICVAALSDIPEEGMLSSRPSHVSQPNGNIRNLLGHSPRGIKNREQIINAYKLMQLQRQNTQHLITRF